MKKLAIAVAMVSACASISEVPLDTAFSLKHGETVAVAKTGLTVTFVDLSDSRCPPDVVCVWEGEVTIQLRANEQLFDIKVPGSATTVDGYSIEVREVTRQPYTATIIVTAVSAK